MAIAKIIFNNENFIDLTNDTLSAETVHDDFVAFGADGVSVTGEEPYPSQENEIIEKKLVSYSNEGLTSVNTYGFIWQQRLVNIYLPNITSIGGYGFYHCEALPSVNFPKVTSIGEYAFHTTALSSIDFPLTTSIGNYAFYDCTSLTAADMSSLTSIGNYGFYGCTSLASFSAPSLTSVGTYCFNDCISLSSLDMSSMTSIGNYSFYNCSSLSNINILNITSIGNSSFYGCSSLQNIESSKVTSIGNGAFQNCTNLQSAILPKLKTLGEGSFRSCTQLVTTNFLSLTGCGSGGSTFNGCSKIPSLVVPSYTGTVNSDFAANCSSLTAIDFGSPSSIGSLSFRNSAKLNILIIRKETLCSLGGTGSFSGTLFASGKTGGILYVPNDLIESYQEATNWSTILAYENNQILPIEGSAYEFYYVDGSPVLYLITKTLTYATSSNSTTEAAYLSSYTTTLKGKAGFNITTATITMGGIDITEDVYNPVTNEISIASVTGPITIEASADTLASYDWDYEWDYTDGLLTSNGWTQTNWNTGGVATMTETGLKLTSNGNTNIMFKNTSYNMAKGVMEVTLAETYNTSTANINGNICLSNGTTGINIISPKGKVGIRNNSTLANCTTFATLSSATDFILRICLDGNVGRVCVDGEKVWETSDVNANNISNYGSNTRLGSESQQSGYYTLIKSIRIKRLD